MEIQHQNGDTRAEVKYRGIKAIPFVIGNETFEKVGTIGTSANLLIYLTTVFHLNSISAINVINVFHGTCNFGTLIGGFFRDTYFGRYNMLGFGSICSFLGMLMLTLTAAVSALHPPECGGADGGCMKATPRQIAFLFTGFGFLVAGASGIRPCNLAFGADQFDPKTESGKRGIASFFNWYYLTFTLAMMVSLTIIVYVQSEKSWPIGLAIPTFLMLLSCVLFFLGTRLYVIVKPEGNPFIGVAQVVVAAVKKRKLKLPENPEALLFSHFSAQGSSNSRLRYTAQFRFLSKAAIKTREDAVNADGSAKNPWRLSTIQSVEEVKSLLRIIPIWIDIVLYLISSVQTHNYVVFQAMQSDRRVGSGTFKIPAASFILFSMFTVTLWVPIFDRIVVPRLRKQTGKPGGMTVLQRMGIGIALSILAMVVSGAISSMSGFWLVPQMALGGFGEAFTLIGMNELFYKQSPENMRTIVGTFFYVAMALSQYFSSFISSFVQKLSTRGSSQGWLAEDLNKGRLDYFYYLMGMLEVLNLFLFLVCAKWYKYKEIVVDGVETDQKLEHSDKSIV